MIPPSCYGLFITFFRIGLFTIGGGYAMIPLIEAEIVKKNRWISKDEFIDLLAISQSAPGVFAVNISIFIGYKLLGLKGCITASVANVLPSIICILLIALFFQQFRHYHIVENIFKGVRPVVVALIVVPIFSIAKSSKLTKSTIWIPILSVFLIVYFNISPIYIIFFSIFGAVVFAKMRRLL